MPFVALCNDKRIVSVDFTPEQWKLMKEHKGNVNLIMPCCGTPAIMKTYSRTGTQFFAHKIRPENCNSKPESEEHLKWKELICRACLDNDASAMPEYNFGDCRADVYCEYNNQRYAFEIQVSRITKDELLTRSEKYKKHGVVVVWILWRDPMKWDCFEWFLSYGLFVQHNNLTPSNLVKQILSGEYKNKLEDELKRRELWEEKLEEGRLKHLKKLESMKDAELVRIKLNNKKWREIEYKQWEENSNKYWSQWGYKPFSKCDFITKQK